MGWYGKHRFNKRRKVKKEKKERTLFVIFVDWLNEKCLPMTELLAPVGSAVLRDWTSGSRA